MRSTESIRSTICDMGNPDYYEQQLPLLPCPECRLKLGAKGGARIGNRRNRCTTCNNFAQNVMRMTRKRLKEAHEAEYERLRMQVEYDLYPAVLEQFRAMYPNLETVQEETL